MMKAKSSAEPAPSAEHTSSAQGSCRGEWRFPESQICCIFSLHLLQAVFLAFCLDRLFKGSILNPAPTLAIWKSNFLEIWIDWFPTSAWSHGGVGFDLRALARADERVLSDYIWTVFLVVSYTQRETRKSKLILNNDCVRWFYVRCCCTRLRLCGSLSRFRMKQPWTPLHYITDYTYEVRCEVYAIFGRLFQ